MYRQFNMQQFYVVPTQCIKCFVWIWEQTAIISLHSINWLVFINKNWNSKARWLIYLKFFGPFPGAPGAPAPFSNSPSPATHPPIFPRFELFFTSFFTTLNLRMIGTQYMYKQGWQTNGPSPIHGPYSFYLTPTPGEKRWIPTSNVTPTPLLNLLMIGVNVHFLVKGHWLQYTHHLSE